MEDSMEIIKQFNEFSRRVQDKFGTQKIRIDEDKRFLSGEQYDTADDSLVSPQRVRQTVNIISNTVNSVVNAYSEYPYRWYTGDNELDQVADEFLKKSANSRATDDALLNSVSFGTAYLVMGTELQQGVAVPTLYSVPNPNDVLFDPDSTAIDGSDATEAAMIRAAWVRSRGRPTISLKSLAVPMGRMPKGTVGRSPAARSRPLATSLRVPSPPAATTAS